MQPPVCLALRFSSKLCIRRSRSVSAFATNALDGLTLFNLDSAVYPHSLNEIYPSVIAGLSATVNTAVVVDSSVVVRSVASDRSEVSVGVKQQYPTLEICECCNPGDKLRTY